MKKAITPYAILISLFLLPHAHAYAEGKLARAPILFIAGEQQQSKVNILKEACLNWYITTEKSKSDYQVQIDFQQISEDKTSLEWVVSQQKNGIVLGNGSDLLMVALDDILICIRDDWKLKSSVPLKRAEYFVRREREMAPRRK